MMEWKKILAVLVLGALGVMLHAELPNRTVEAEGVGETVEKALSDARRNAVRKVFGEVIDSVTEIRNDGFEESTISASSGFIVAAERLGEPEYSEESKAYKVKIRATVATDKVKDHINRFRTGGAKIDIAGEFRAAATAEAQEKNVMEAFLRFDLEFYKTLKATDFKSAYQDGSLVFEVGIGQDRRKFETLIGEFKRCLVENGYSRIGGPDDPVFKRSRGGATVGFVPSPCPRCYRRGFPNYSCTFREHHEIYCNPEVSIFCKDYPSPGGGLMIPRNFGKAALELQLVGADGERFGIARNNLIDEFISLSYRMTVGNADHAHGIIGKALKTRCKLEPKFRNVAAAELVVLCERPEGTIRTTLGSIPLNIGDAFSRQQSLAERGDGYAQLITRHVKEFNKSMTAKAQVKYDRNSGSILLAVDFSVDRRGFFAALRKMQDQLRHLGIHKDQRRQSALEVEVYDNDPPQERVRIVTTPIRPPTVYVNGVPRRAAAPRRVEPPHWPQRFYIPDGEGKIKGAIYRECKKLNYAFVVRFKDAAGDVLQTYETPVTEIVPMRLIRGAVVLVPTARHWDIPVPFDIPEDIGKIRDIEYVIEERVSEE